MADKKTRYVVARSERAIFAEIYFPKRAAYQGAIFDALRYGYDEDKVKLYLHENAEALLEELKDYHALDPKRYTTEKRRRTLPSLEGAHQRIDMYASPFKGWSMYSVDGVFFDKDHTMYEEATQVVRIMFRFESPFTTQAVAVECDDVLRAMLFWVISRQGRIADRNQWDKAERASFLEHHKFWPRHKRAFARQHFADIVKDAAKWMNDCALFVFGYLVRKFADQVLTERLYEEEIWVTSFFTLTVNVIGRTGPEPEERRNECSRNRR